MANQVCMMTSEAFESCLGHPLILTPIGTSTYPGCGCDLPSHLYSFSFNLNPNWSKELCEQPEILQCTFCCLDKWREGLAVDPDRRKL